MVDLIKKWVEQSKKTYNPTTIPPKFMLDLHEKVKGTEGSCVYNIYEHVDHEVGLKSIFKLYFHSVHI